MKIDDYVSINSEAVSDMRLTESKGFVLDLWNEPLTNSAPTPLAKVILSNGDEVVVGQHEINLIK